MKRMVSEREWLGLPGPYKKRRGKRSKESGQRRKQRRRALRELAELYRLTDGTGEPNDLAVADELSKAALVLSNPLGQEGEVGSAQVASTNEKMSSRTAPDS